MSAETSAAENRPIRRIATRPRRTVPPPAAVPRAEPVNDPGRHQRNADHRYAGIVQTRYLILAALATGVVILVAAAIYFTLFL